MRDLISPAHREVWEAVSLLQNYCQLAVVKNVCLCLPDRVVDDTKSRYQDDRAGETSVRLGDHIPNIECSVWDRGRTRVMRAQYRKFSHW